MGECRGHGGVRGCDTSQKGVHVLSIMMGWLIYQVLTAGSTPNGIEASAGDCLQGDSWGYQHVTSAADNLQLSLAHCPNPCW